MMNEKELQERIQMKREFMLWDKSEFVSDQNQQKPQPPLAKPAMTDRILALPKNFKELPMKQDLVDILFARRSNRVFTEQPVSLEALSFLLWASQGVKGLRGKSYATLRTVPSAGARHPFEVYVYAKQVDGLPTGLYHYLPMTHEIECLKETDPKDAEINAQVIKALHGQKWAEKASVVFFYSAVMYRGEWRYSVNSHRVMLIDAGHAVQNLYIGCTALGLGTCAIAALTSEAADDLFGLDGKEETIFYAAPVGTISEENEDQEQAFYAFLKEEKK